MKEKIKQFWQSKKSIFWFIFIAEFILMLFITPNKYDDATFLGWLEQNPNIFSIVVDRYQNWTSRVIIDYTIFSILKTSKYLWVFLQAAMMTLLGYSISKLFVKEEYKEEMNIMIVLLILAYPIDIMAGAGWAASTANYMWPLATLLFALIPIKQVWQGEKIRWFSYIFYMISLIYACNQEQTCAIMVGVYFVFSVLLILKNKKIHPFIIIQLLLAIASMVFILTTPGNYVRQGTEIINQFPNFNMLTLQDKLSLGITTTMGTIIKNLSIPFGILSLMVMVYVFVTYKEKLYRVIALIPFLAICIFGYFEDIFFHIFKFLPELKEILTAEQVILTPANCNNLFYALPIILSIIVFLSLIISILLIFKNLNKNIAIFVFLVGLASRLIMGFSPTVFISSVRTILFFDFAMLIVALLIWQEFLTKTDKNEKKVQRRVFAIVEVTAVLQYLNMFIVILLTQK